jgi:hypothetical protein
LLDEEPEHVHMVQGWAHVIRERPSREVRGTHEKGKEMKVNHARQCRSCERSLLGLCLTLCLTAGPAVAQTAFLSLDNLREGWESTYGSIGSMKVTYCQRLIDFRPSPGEPNAPAPVRLMHVRRLEQGPRYYLTQSRSEQGFSRREDLLSYAFDGERSTSYVGARRDGEIRLGLQDAAAPLTNHLKQYLLLDGMRFRNRDEDIPVFRHYSSQKNARVLPDLETVAGVPCHVIEIEGTKGNVKIWIAHEKGFLPLQFERTVGDPEHGYIFERRSVQALARAETDTGAFWYPAKARRFLRDHTGQESTNEITVSAFVPNVPVTKEDFRIAFPSGTRMIDNIAGMLYRVGVAPDTDLPQVPSPPADMNEPTGVGETALGMHGTTETPVASAPPAQKDRNGLMAQALPRGGRRRVLCLTIAGLGIVLLLAGIRLLRTGRGREVNRI